MTSSRADLPMPGLLWGDYPERVPRPHHLAERWRAALRAAAGRLADAADGLRRRRDAAWLAQVHAAWQRLAALDDTRARHTVQHRLGREGLAGPLQIEALALVALMAQRHLGLQAFDSQLIAARAVLDQQLAEMATGEGKTLAVALAACVAALAGMPVHVVTANDYLVARDAQRLQPLAEALGLSVGRVTQADAAPARAPAYACNICLVTAKELVFDYLRDGLGGAGLPHAPGARAARRHAPPAALARLAATPAEPALLRGLCLAIVDEADAILIDEARVPLILSQRGPRAPDPVAPVLAFARQLRAGEDYRLLTEHQLALLTPAGQARLDDAAEGLAQAADSPAWRHRSHREHAVCTALAALHLYRAERHYLVRDGRVQIIDDTTGRIAEGRVWSQGLQQFIECKEGCAPTAPMQTLAQITYQRFFPRYVRLGGLSGTLREARAELMSTYGVAVRRVPLRRPGQRQVGRMRLFADHSTLWDAAARRAEVLHRQGRPVLLAADSVAEAQALSQHLARRGLPHAVLHARNDQDEAEVVARAGQPGAVTVTTNLSGRGTDIELGPGVRERGGLHVLSCQLNSAARIDRQLAGRAARQGDPGSVETWLSLDTTLLAQNLPAPLRAALRRHAAAWPAWAVRSLARSCQCREEQRQRTQRQRLIEHDDRIARQLGFARGAE